MRHHNHRRREERDLFNGVIQWHLGNVHGVSALLPGAKRAFPNGGHSPALNPMRVAWLHDPRAQPGDGLRIVDLREDPTQPAACVRLCKSPTPHHLFDCAAPPPQGEFDYLLLTEATPAPQSSVWWMPHHDETGSPIRTENLGGKPVRRFSIESQNGALPVASDLLFTDDTHRVWFYLGYMALQLGAGAVVERIRPPDGYVRPMALITQVDDDLVKEALAEGFAAFTAGQVTIVYSRRREAPPPFNPNPAEGEESQAEWEFPRCLPRSARLKLLGFESGGQIAGEEKGAACALTDLDGEPLRETASFCPLNSVPCGVHRGLSTVREPAIVAASFKWAAPPGKPPSRQLVIRTYRAEERDGGAVVKTRVEFVGDPLMPTGFSQDRMAPLRPAATAAMKLAHRS